MLLAFTIMWFALFLLCLLLWYMPSYSSVRGVLPISCRSNPYQYVHDAFRRNNYVINHKFISNDTRFITIPYEVKQNMLWNNASVCNTATFLLLVYFVHVRDLERRNLIRQYVKQGMIVDGKKINYVFVVASPLRKKEVLHDIKEENTKNGDILLSVHEDNYPNITITHLDAMLWVRDYCKETVFVARVDGDVWIHLGNLIHYLKSIQPYRYYGGGIPWSGIIEHGAVYKSIHTIPFDFPAQRWTANVGGAILYSRDVIPFINIGTQYMEILLPLSDDNTIGEILSRAGIKPSAKPRDYTLYTHSYTNTSIVNNTVFQHGIKDIQLLKEIYSNYSSVYLIPYNLQLLVC